MALRRRGRGSHRFVNWQVGLFFLAAGIWLGGVVTGIHQATFLSIAVLLAAIVLGMTGRRGQQD